MRTSRRIFLKEVVGVVSVLLGGTQLSGCLGGGGGSEQSTTSAAATQSGSETAAAPATQPTPAAPSAAAPTATGANAAPVWQPSPAIEFVEGVPTVVSVRDFVKDPDSDPLVIALQSGTFLPGITWNPSNATIAYDGRPLGAKPDQPVVLTGIIFSADDRR